MINNCNDKYYIYFTKNTYSTEFKQKCYIKGISVYYIDINWILKQGEKCPKKLEYVKITDINSNDLL